MKLDVPLYTQKIGSVDCGHICLRMILKYHGIGFNYQRIKSEISTHEVGTYTPQLGLFLMKNGFQTDIITMNPGLFSVRDSGISQDKVLAILKSVRNKSTKPDDKITLDYFVKYIQKGGRVTPRIPDVKTIKTEIKNKRPILVLLTSNFLTGTKRKFNFHFNVITGIDKIHIYVNDPLMGIRGGRKKYKISDYFYAIHTSAYGDLDNASLMTIKK